MLKNTFFSFFAFTSAMKILTWEFFCVVREITVITSVTITSQEKFAQITNGWLLLNLLLSRKFALLGSKMTFLFVLLGL
jgi:hypothetical protein